ncbi:hypothetical protein F4679DRAFT_584479 [Xylaria curta]|nr:hypothetical protein F4679DRAFT_584479 [Xylaria curta]
MVYRAQDLAYRAWSNGLGWWLTGCNMAASRFGVGSYFPITALQDEEVLQTNRVESRRDPTMHTI